MSIQEHLNKIRNAIYGREVRESIAKGIETAYDDASEKDNANMEVKIARGTHPNLRSRLEEVDNKQQQTTAQLAQKATKEELQTHLYLKRDKNAPISLNDLDAETLAAIEGGEGTEFNLLSIPQDESVTPPKTTFMKRTRNLFDGKYKNMSVAGSVGGNGTVSIGNPDSRTAIVPIKNGETYSIKIHETEKANRFRIGAHTKELTRDDFDSNNTTLLSITELLFFNDSSKEFSFTSNLDGFVYVTVSNQASEPLIQIEQSEIPTDYVHPYLVKDEFIPKHKSKDDPKQEEELTKLSRSNKKRLDEKMLFPMVANTEMTITDPGARFIEYFDGKMWGYTFGNGDISYSTDEGKTWTVHTNKEASFTGAVHRLLPTNDGEVLAMTGGNIYKSSGWSTGTVTWSTGKVTKHTNAVLFQFSFDGDGTKFIIVEYANGTANWADSRNVWISTDMGETFNVVWDSLTENGQELNDITHLHGACYDRWGDRFYFSQGHGASGGLYCSTDDGATWVQGKGHRDGVLTSGGIVSMEGDTNGPTVLVATPRGLVMGSDNARNGMFGLVRKENPLDEVVTRTYKAEYERKGVIMFAIRGFLDEKSGTVYVAFRSEFNDVPPIICAGTPTEADLIYEYPNLPVVGASDHFGAIAKTSDGRLVTYAQFNGNPYTMQADLVYPASEIQTMVRLELRRFGLI